MNPQNTQTMHNTTQSTTLTTLTLLLLPNLHACLNEETCVSLSGSSNSCGECGIVCEASQVCYLGQCQLSCPSGIEQCGPICCDSSEVCSDGECIPRCDEGTSCDQGKVCNASNQCVAGCFIDGKYHPPGGMNQSIYCMTCSTANPTSWTPVPGTPCENGTQLDPAAGYGMITSINVDTDFVFAADRQSDAAYMNLHENEGMRFSPAFFGRYQRNNASIPPGGSSSVVSAYKTKAGLVMVDQMSYVSVWGDWANPVVRMFVADSALVGPAPIGHEPGDQAQLMVYDIANGSSLCVAAVGVGGSIQVTKAQDLKQADGGKLAFTGSNIMLYHPTATPYLPSNISDSLGGTPICPPK